MRLRELLSWRDSFILHFQELQSPINTNETHPETAGLSQGTITKKKLPGGKARRFFRAHCSANAEREQQVTQPSSPEIFHLSHYTGKHRAARALCLWSTTTCMRCFCLYRSTKTVIKRISTKQAEFSRPLSHFPPSSAHLTSIPKNQPGSCPVRPHNDEQYHRGSRLHSPFPSLAGDACLGCPSRDGGTGSQGAAEGPVSGRNFAAQRRNQRPGTDPQDGCPAWRDRISGIHSGREGDRPGSGTDDGCSPRLGKSRC